MVSSLRHGWTQRRGPVTGVHEYDGKAANDGEVSYDNEHEAFEALHKARTATAPNSGTLHITDWGIEPFVDDDPEKKR